MFIRRLWQILYLCRLENSLHPILAIVAGFFVSGSMDYAGLLYGIGALILLHSLVTVWNDIEDEDVDTLNGRSELQQLRNLGGMTLLKVMLVVMVVGLLWCVAHLPAAVAILFGFYAALSWMYNAKPVQASRRPVMSMVVMWLAYGLIPVLIGLSFGVNSVIGLLFAFTWSIARLSLSLLKDFKDAPGDAAASKRTFLLVFGTRAVATWSTALAGVGMTGVMVCLYLLTANTVFLWLLPLALGLLYDRLRLFTIHSYQALHEVFRRALSYQALTDGMVVICLIIWSRS